MNRSFSRKLDGDLSPSDDMLGAGAVESLDTKNTAALFAAGVGVGGIVGFLYRDSVRRHLALTLEGMKTRFGEK